MDEFSLIDKYFRPLAKDFPASLNLADDAAVLDIPAGKQLIATKDVITEGVHFIGREDPALVARKLLRVNLSDLAAMGAVPFAYLLGVSFPKKVNPVWVKKFAKGLADDQRLFGISLAGGDTTATPGPLSLSLTALGLAPKGQAIKRSGAQAGDDIYVSGTIGDAAIGLLCFKKKLPADRFLQLRYLLPQPRVALGEKLRGTATSCIDISDGLMQDLGHICATSKTHAKIERHMIPLSRSAAALIKKHPSLWEHILGGGDDYELLFTAPKDKARQVAAIAKNLKVPVTRIGSMAKGSRVTVMNKLGKPLSVQRKGFRHFS